MSFSSNDILNLFLVQGHGFGLVSLSPYQINIQKQITEAFGIFDESGKGKIDINNVEIIVRALGQVPRNKEMKEFLKLVEDPHSEGYVKLEALLPALTKILLEDKWKPASKEQLLQAFKYFDPKEKGHLCPKYMKKLLTEHGDKMNEEEIEKFLDIMVNSLSGKIEYLKCYKDLVIPNDVDICENKLRILRELRNEQDDK